MPNVPRARVFDITISGENDREKIIEIFKEIAKKWTFQLEKGEQTGYLHYQCRVNLKEKMTTTGLASNLRANSLVGSIFVSPTSEVNRNNMFYVTKTDTKVEGPWSDTDKPSLRTVSKIEKLGLHPWQKSLADKVREYDDRTIHVLIDQLGNHGKSAFCKYMWEHENAQPMPGMMKCGQDIIQFAMCQPYAKTYIIDMPRAMKKSKLYEFYSGIETLKNGMLYDTRYHGRFTYIDEPNIIVMTNCMPKLKYLSRDRWQMWEIENNELVPFKFEPRVSKVSKS